MPKRHPRGWWSLSNFDMFPFIFKKISILTMMISIQRLQRTSPWSKICASRGFESVKPRCLLKICFRRTCLFTPEIWSSGAHQTPTIGGTRVESSSGFGGNGEIPWDPPGKVWKPRIFDKNCRKCHNLLGQVFFFLFSNVWLSYLQTKASGHAGREFLSRMPSAGQGTSIGLNR